MTERDYNVGIKIVSVEGRLIRPSKKNRGIGNDWTIDPEFLGWAPENIIDIGDIAKDARVVNRCFTFKTKGKQKSSKKINQNHGVVNFGKRKRKSIINVFFHANLEERDPKFNDVGNISATLNIVLTADKAPQKHTIKGIVNARGGDEPGAVEFTFNIEVTVSAVGFEPGRFIDGDGRELIRTVPRSKAKSLEIFSSPPISPGVDLGYLNPNTRIQLFQALNTISAQFNAVRTTTLAITEFIQNSTVLQTLIKALPSPSATLVDLSIKRVGNILKRAELPDYDTGTAKKTISVKNNLDSLPDTLFGTPKTLTDMILKALVKQFLSLFGDLYISIGKLIAAIQLLNKLKITTIPGSKPIISKQRAVQIRLNNPEKKDIGRPVTVVLAVNSIRGRINTPVTALNHPIKLKINNRTINPKLRIDGRSNFRLPANALLEGNYKLLGNYGVIDFFATFIDNRGQKFTTKSFITIYNGVFEQEVREFEKNRHQSEKDFINTIAGDIVNNYFDGILSIIDSALDLLSQIIGLLEAIPALGGLVSNISKFVIALGQENLKAEIALGKIALSSFQTDYNKENDQLNETNLTIAEKYPEQGGDGEREIVR